MTVIQLGSAGRIRKLSDLGRSLISGPPRSVGFIA